MSSRSDKEAHTEGILERTEVQCWHQRLSGAGSVMGKVVKVIRWFPPHQSAAG